MNATRIPVSDTVRNLTSLFLDPMLRTPVYRLVKEFPITLPDGTVWKGSMWARRDGSRCRRFQVRNSAGVGLYDTDDCHDFGNARFKLEQWLATQIPDTLTPRAA